jgi:hypothetical protein
MTIQSRWLWAGILVFATSSPAIAQQQQSIAGRIKVASGAAYIVRGGAAVRAQLGDAVYVADSLRTGNDGKIGVTLADDTRVSLGPNSEAQLEKFVYAPAQGGLALAMKFMRGVAAYVSGRIAKLAPDAVRLETPAAIVGVRGTTLAIRVDP